MEDTATPTPPETARPVRRGQGVWLGVVGAAFILIDLARLRTPVPAETGGDRRGPGLAAGSVNGLP
ncbi:hypothetical protein [Streptomyces globisporus]|uniref:hypothetical protein n=1 Tax=Streptomyces globisporus TaxID=1908 RepID=UPI0004C91E70|nr:hypothetical protein [Streptomyces globisporus]